MGGPALINGSQVPETDNFFPASFEENGIRYQSAEQYFQCAKACNVRDFQYVLHSPVHSMYAAGQNITLRTDWENIKVKIMFHANYLKYRQNPQIAAVLGKTEGPILCTSSTPFWNEKNCYILNEIRALIKDGLL